MRTVRLPLLRGALFIIALAAIAFILARGDNPAQATTYNPSNFVSVSDPNPGAAADISIAFALQKPDSFPNVRTNSTIQFLPRSWGVNPDAPIGGVAGSFNALSTLGTLGINQCIYPIPVPFTMYDASVDTSNVTSSMDVGGDLHPGGAGYSGQFVLDPETLEPPPDLNLPLINFAANEKHTAVSWGYHPSWGNAYRDVDGDNLLSAGDIRLGGWLVQSGFDYPAPYSVGSVVQPGDRDLPSGSTTGAGLKSFGANEKHSDLDGNGQMDAGEYIYRDVDWSGTVSYGDVRLFQYEELLLPSGSVVEPFGLRGGISRYPDFLNQMFPPEVVGEPLARMWAGRQVLTTAVSLNIVTFRPGQLPGYPASLGYPNVVILLNPVAPVDMIFINQTSDLCTPLALTSTNFGVSQDNPSTLADEAGYVRLTNPKAEKSHDFTLVTTSQPDADDDGIENMLDTCPLTPNTENLDERSGPVSTNPGPGDPDGDDLDGACDPDPLMPSGYNPPAVMDEDRDSYGNRADNCSVTANGREFLGLGYQQVPGFEFVYAITGDLIGPSNQADTDGDDIGDACEGAEAGAQCLNDIDDDSDGVVNDGCPTNPIGYGEKGAQCLNDIDDDGDGWVNDGCPAVGARAESATAQTLRVFLHPDNVIASSQYSNWYSKEKAFDGNTSTGWCTSGSDKAPGNYIEAQFASPQDVSSLDLLNQWRWEAFTTGRITMSSGFSQDITLTNGGGTFTFPAQSGVTWVRFTGLTQNGWDACFTEFNLNLSVVNVPAECGNDTDDDGDGVVNDGCPAVQTPAGPPESGDQCLNAIDDDGDGLVNDGCPVVDPSDVAKTTPTGHKHVVSITNVVTIARHGVKLDDLDGNEKVAAAGSASYKVSLENKGGSAEDFPVAVRVIGGCGTVSGPATVHVNGDASANANFTVDFSGCAAGEYTVQADACHAGDPAPNGFFGAGTCPGTSDVPQPPSGALELSGATASSEAFGPAYSAAKAIDGNTESLWCTGFAEGVNIQASFSSPVSIDRVDIEDSYGAMGYAWVTGTLEFSNGYSQDVTLSAGAGSFTVPLQSGVEWLKFTATEGGWAGCISELKAFGFIPIAGDTNPLDDAPRSITVVVAP